MEINITDFVKNANTETYCNSIVNSGLKNIGEITWNNAKTETKYSYVTEDNKNKFIAYFDEFGCWDDLEIWSISELNGLFIQFISGDLQEYEFEIQENIPEDERKGTIYIQEEEYYFTLGF